jgi:AcrR family transcriptional regulator
MISENPRRPYRKRRRAAQEAETRRRITEAAMRLHGTIGPARTTMQQIAAAARVQRATVYRHFPDADALFQACSAHWASLNPPPDPATWAAIRDPDARLRQALAELYAWYARTEPMLTNVIRDAPLVPACGRAAEEFGHHFTAMSEALMRGRPSRGRPRARQAAATAHALAFPTWQSLVREHGLTPTEARNLMLSLVASAAKPAA